MRLSEEELARRGARVQQTTPIRRTSGPRLGRGFRLGTSHIVIGTHDEARPTSHYRIGAASISAKHHGMYLRRGGAKHETASSSIRHISTYTKKTTTEIEIICLHCDPSLLPNADHAKYKRGPHIHMSIAGSPYDSAHIALQGPDLAPV